MDPETIAGVLINAFGSICLNFGNNLQSLSHKEDRLRRASEYASPSENAEDPDPPPPPTQHASPPPLMFAQRPSPQRSPPSGGGTWSSPASGRKSLASLLHRGGRGSVSGSTSEEEDPEAGEAAALPLTPRGAGRVRPRGSAGCGRRSPPGVTYRRAEAAGSGGGAVLVGRIASPALRPPPPGPGDGGGAQTPKAGTPSGPRPPADRQDPAPAALGEEQRRRRRRRVWVAGTGCFAAGTVAVFVSYSFAPQSLLAPLGAVQFVSNVAFGRLVHGAPVTARALASAGVIVAGLALVRGPNREIR